MKTLHDYIPDNAAEPWAEFVKMRKAKRAPLTPYAEKLMLGRIAAYMADGQDAAAMLNQSILNGWTNVYPVKDEQRVPQHVGAPRLALVDQQAQNNAEAKRRLFGVDN